MSIPALLKANDVDRFRDPLKPHADDYTNEFVDSE
jgi:hypothetical protein